MSSQPQPTKFTKANRKNALAITLIVMVTIVGVGIFGYFFGKREGTNSKSPIPVIDVTKVSRPAVLGEQTYSWNGNITKLEKSKMFFTTSVTDDQGIAKAKELTASISSATKLTKWDLSKPPSTTDNTASQVTIPLAEFKVGQQIIVQSPSNFDGQNTIDAASVSLLITPTSQ